MLIREVRAMNATADELERLAETHELCTLTEEEERMIFSFRDFKSKPHKPGAIFKWQTHPEREGGEPESRIIRPDNSNRPVRLAR